LLENLLADALCPLLGDIGKGAVDRGKRGAKEKVILAPQIGPAAVAGRH
jgi:hypothetical protein